MAERNDNQGWCACKDKLKGRSSRALSCSAFRQTASLPSAAALAETGFDPTRMGAGNAAHIDVARDYPAVGNLPKQAGHRHAEIEIAIDVQDLLCHDLAFAPTVSSEARVHRIDGLDEIIGQFINPASRT